MTPREYQMLAMRTKDDVATDRLFKAVHDHEGTADMLTACMGLSGETGELVDMFKKHIFHEKPLDEEHAVKELGDVMWYVALLCDAMDWDLETVMAMNIKKLEARYPEGFDVNRANHRKKGDV